MTLIEHVLCAAAMIGELGRAIVEMLHHLALRLQLRASHHRPVRRHDPGCVIGQRDELAHRIDPPTEPAARVPVERRITQGRGHVTDCQNVRVPEEHVNVAARVSFEQVAALNGFRSHLELTLLAERRGG